MLAERRPSPRGDGSGGALAVSRFELDDALAVKQAIERLPERHRYVLRRRYGLDDRDTATLAELSNELDISRERVRQLQREAERRLASGEFGAAFRDAA